MTRAQFKTAGSEQSGSRVDIDCLHNISELFVVISNMCGLSTTQNLARVFQLEDFGTQV